MCTPIFLRSPFDDVPGLITQHAGKNTELSIALQDVT